VTPQIDTLTVEGAKLSRPIDAGTVVMAVSGNVGVVSRLAIDACVHDGFVAFKQLSAETVRPDFFLWQLHLAKALHQQSTAGAIFKNLTTKDIKGMKIICPPLSLQDEFVRFSADSREHLVRMHRGGQQLDTLFGSLQQRAFRGEL
jgi:hypothetical protein